MSSISLQSALTDGLRLASIILAIGMANSLANPRKLLKSTPGALYEIATAISIAINLAPQLISSLNRVRKARELRGQSRGMRALPGIVIPVLEDTIDQSMALAASMSARGFGRRGSKTKANQVLVRTLGLSGITALAVGVFLLLISPATQILDLALVGLGVFLTFLYIHLSSAGSLRTRYRKEPWRIGDYLLLFITASILFFSFGGVLSL
jgi:energy-coupling factor transport system permease protein